MDNEKSVKKKDLFINKSIIAAIVLFLLISLCSWSYNKRTKTLNQGDCFSTLSNSSSDAAQRIDANLNGGLDSLRIVAGIISQGDPTDAEYVSQILEVYETNPIAASISVLTAENVVITEDGNTIDADGIIDFAEELAEGEHICETAPSLFTHGKMMLRGFVPIIKDGKTVAMLFNELDPEAIASYWAPDMYDGASKFTIINRKTGNVLVNNAPAVTNNIGEIHNERLIGETKAGKNGYMAFPIEGELTFACYLPMETPDWEIIFFVGSDKTLAASDRMKKNFHMFLIEEGIVFLVFMAWIIYFNRTAVRNTEKSANSDTLTDLPNRNMYEIYCRRKEDDPSDLACIYIDVNSLHEINNSQGHLAGDQMLRFVADTLKIAFSGADIFRIGGDEFIVFQEKSSGSGIDLKVRAVKEQLKNNNYHISAGISYGSSKSKMKDIIKDAETKMFSDKKAYYEDLGMTARNFIQTPIDSVDKRKK